MNNRIVPGVVCTLFATLLLQGTGNAQRLQLSKSIDRAKLLQKPAFKSYHKLLARTQSKVASGGGKALVTKTNSLGKTEVVVNVSPQPTPVRASGAASTQRNGNRVCESQDYVMDYVNLGVFNNYERTLPVSIFPGAFIDAASLLNNRPSFYSAPNRTPLTVAISINDRDSIRKFTASNFGSNYTPQLHAALRNQSFNTNIPAYVDMSSVEINSQTQLQANFDLTVGLMVPLEALGIPVEISQGISLSHSDTASQKVYSYLLTYEQPMYDYTVSEIDRSLFFNNGASASQHPNAVFVRSVVYGRRITMLIKSTESLETASTTVRERLGVSTTGEIGVSVGAQIDASIVQKFSQQIRSFQAFVQGGNAAFANKIFSNPGEIKTYLEDPNASKLSAASGELPIQYVLERVSEDAAIGVRSTANYNAQSCIQPHFTFQIEYKGMKCNKAVEFIGDDKEDVFGTFSAGGKTILDINENKAISIKQGTTSADLRLITINDKLPLDQVSNYTLTFTSGLKDWEPAHKPEFRFAQPLDARYIINPARLSKIMALDKGESVYLETGVQEAKLYENSDKSSASISVLYRIKVRRN